MKSLSVGIIGAVLINMTLSKMMPRVDHEAFERTYLALIVIMLAVISWQLAGIRRRR